MSDTPGSVSHLPGWPARPGREGWDALADRIARSVQDFLDGVEALARGEGGNETVPLLLLEVSQIQLAGAQLGATTDVILPDNSEPEVGADPDLDELRTGLAKRFAPYDDYLEIFDPYADSQATPFRLSDDVAAVAADLVHGLKHYQAGPSRRCGGGSTRTSTTGALTAAPRCGRCTPWSRTLGSTWTRNPHPADHRAHRGGDQNAGTFAARRAEVFAPIGRPLMPRGFPGRR